MTNSEKAKSQVPSDDYSVDLDIFKILTKFSKIRKFAEKYQTSKESGKFFENFGSPLIKLPPPPGSPIPNPEKFQRRYWFLINIEQEAKDCSSRLSEQIIINIH